MYKWYCQPDLPQVQRKKRVCKVCDVSLGNNDDSILKVKTEQQDTDDEGQTSDDNSSGDEDDEDNNITAADFVSARCDREDEQDKNITARDFVWGICDRMWYPAKVCTFTNVPENMYKLFCNNLLKLI